MTEIISYLPNIIIYLVLGFVFIKVFRFVYIEESPNDSQHILTESLIYGFILQNIYSAFPISINTYIDIIGMVLSTVIIAYFLAKFIYSKLFSKILAKLKIQQTPIKDFWIDITHSKERTYITVYDKESDRIINGRFARAETFNKRPLIQLSEYIIKNTRGDIISDMSLNTADTIVIDTSKYPEIMLSHPQPKDKKESEETQSEHNPIKSTLNKIKTKFHHD